MTEKAGPQNSNDASFKSQHASFWVTNAPARANRSGREQSTHLTPARFFAAAPGNTALVAREGFLYIEHMKEIVFEVTQEADGGLIAESLTESIFTQADGWEELRTNVSDAVNGYFFDQEKPENIRLHLVRDEVMATG